MCWLRQLLMSIVFRRDAIYCVLMNYVIQLFSTINWYMKLKTKNSKLKTKKTSLLFLEKVVSLCFGNSLKKIL